MGLRVAELETLFTANVDQVEKAEKRIKVIGEKIESSPIKVTADDSGALASMDRVEQAAKRLVSREQVLRLDADISRGEKSVERITARLEALQIRALGGLDVTADTRRAEAALQKAQRQLDGLKQARAVIEVDGDPSDALAAVSAVDRATKQLVSRDVAVQVNANVARAEQAVADIRGELDYLRALSTTVDVTADVAQAESRLAGAEAALRDLNGARATMQVIVDDGGAKGKLQDVADYAEEAGDDGGKRGGAALVTGIIAGLATIPIAGAIAKIGEAAGNAIAEGFRAGLAIEARYDRLAALTGLDTTDALRIGRAAAESYANAFGQSIEANMDTARLSLQFDLIDENATTRDAQKVIQGLAGISDVLDEDVRPVATAVSTLLRSGMATSAQQAYDIIAAGAREGLNRNEDLLDTLTEYPVVLTRLGLTGEEMLGLINQGLEAGARNTDVIADGLKEFQIRATDASTSSAAGFERLGLSAEDMTAKIARGGADAREGLQIVLDKLRETEDPVQRNAAAVELFGTKAEDLGEALFALDLSNAVQQLDGVQGAAQRMFDTLTDNDATRLERAKRNIEVAVEGIQGALASAFTDPIADAADFISKNRGPVLQFFLDLANGALDFGASVVEGTATGTEALGEFVSGPLADFVFSVADVLGKLPFPFNQDTSALKESAEQMRGFQDVTTEAASTMRTDWIGAIEDARGKLNEFGEGAVALGYVNDASLRLADAIAAVGSESGSMESQVRAALAALSDEVAAADAASESQANLTDRYNAGTQALLEQMIQSGLTEEKARELINTVLETPATAETEYSSNASDEQRKVQGLADRITTLPDGTVVVYVDTSPAEESLRAFRAAQSSTPMSLRAYMNRVDNASGNILEFMASGGIPGLTPMPSLAAMVPANTWRVVGDRGDVPELYAPLDGSARSWALLMEGLQRMPGSPPSAAPVPVAAASTGERVTVQETVQFVVSGRVLAEVLREYERSR